MQTITPYLLYEDAAAAMDCLARAFGFEETNRVAMPDGRVGHVYVHNVNAHCERAQAAGAEIVDEPEDQEYGDRRYHRDPEEHSWYFAQRLGG